MQDAIGWAWMLVSVVGTLWFCKRVWHPGMTPNRYGMGYMKGDEWFPFIFLAPTVCLAGLFILDRILP